MTVLYVLLALLVFSVMIFVHELGHYIFARKFGVTVEEFAIGMGPKLISRKSEKTGIVYSLRAFPMGGFVSMVGENEESEDENALCKKPAWQRLIIMVAGAAMNVLLGVILMFTLVCSSDLATATVDRFTSDNAVTYEQGLREGDVIVRINRTPIHIGNELVYEIMQQGTESAEVTILRDGREMTLTVDFPTVESEGITFGARDFYLKTGKKTVGSILVHTFYRSTSTVKMIWESLIDLIGGKYGLKHISGPVGVTQAITTAAKTGILDLIYLASVMCINLGIFNLLPVPALDGGRAAFLLIEVIRRKPISPRVEGYIHAAGLALLLLLMVIISFKDVFQLIF